MLEKNRKKESHPFLTLAEVQALLGVKSRKTILKYIFRGHLPAYKLGGTRWRIAREDVNKFLNAQQVETASFTGK